MCSTSPDHAVLTELRDWDGVKVIANYAGLPFTCKETKALSPSLISRPFPPPVFDLTVCKYRGGRPGRFAHMQLRQVDRK